MRGSLVALIILLSLSCLHESAAGRQSCRLRVAKRRQGLIVEGTDATSWCKDLGYTQTAWHLYKKDCKIHCRLKNDSRRQIFSADGEQCDTNYRESGSCTYGVCLPGPKTDIRRDEFAPVQISVLSGQVAKQEPSHDCKVLIRYVNSPDLTLKPFEYDDDICELRTRNIQANICTFQDSCTLFPINKRTTIQVSIHNNEYMEPSQDCRQQVVVGDILDKGQKEISFACPNHKVSLEIRTYSGLSPSPVIAGGSSRPTDRPPVEAPNAPPNGPEGEYPAGFPGVPPALPPPRTTPPQSAPSRPAPTEPASGEQPNQFEGMKPPPSQAPPFDVSQSNFRPWVFQQPVRLRPSKVHSTWWRRPHQRQRWLESDWPVGRSDGVE